MKYNVILIFVALFLMMWAEPISAIGLGAPGPCVARNALEAYCVNHGGCPRDGNCYFPDGGYCELRSFYNGTCPGQAYYEEAIWMAMAYDFLNGGYSTPYMPSYYTPYYYTYPGAYQAGYPYGYQNNAYYYGPTYASGYGM